jgi:hypothetical protein
LHFLTANLLKAHAMPAGRLVEGDVNDSRGASDQPLRVNARTWLGVLAEMGLAAALAGWMVVFGSVPHAGWLWSLQGSDRFAWELFTWASSFLVIWRVILGRTIEWTVADGELRRRRWLSRPGSRPSAVIPLGPGSEIVHETRSRWRVWPDGSEILVWPGQTSQLTRAMRRAGVRVDDFRGDWEREHRGLNSLARLAYRAGVVAFLAAPAVGIALDTGLPLLMLVAAGVAASVGQSIDRQPWTRPKTSLREE